MSQKFSKWGLAKSALIIFFIVLFGQIIRYFVNGEFKITVIIGAFLGTVPLALINLIHVRRKNDNTPDIDERTHQNVLTFIAYASQILFLVLMILLTVVTLVGIEEIPIIFLWIIMLLNMFVISIGSMIVMRR